MQSKYGGWNRIGGKELVRCLYPPTRFRQKLPTSTPFRSTLSVRFQVLFSSRHRCAHSELHGYSHRWNKPSAQADSRWNNAPVCSRTTESHLPKTVSTVSAPFLLSLYRSPSTHLATLSLIARGAISLIPALREYLSLRAPPEISLFSRRLRREKQNRPRPAGTEDVRPPRYHPAFGVSQHSFSLLRERPGPARKGKARPRPGTFSATVLSVTG